MKIYENLYRYQKITNEFESLRLVNPGTQNQNLMVNQNCQLLVSSFSTKIKNFGDCLPVFACLPEAYTSDYRRNFSAKREKCQWRQK